MRNVEDNKTYDQGSEVSSSVATSRRQYYLILKQVELSEQRTLRFKWLLVHVICKWLWVISILIASFYFSSSTRTVVHTSKERLDTISDLIELQYTLRVNANTFYRQWLSLVTVAESDLENRLIPVPVSPLTTEIKRGIYKGLNNVSGGSYIKFSNERIAKSTLGQSASSVQFELKRWENTLFDVEYHFLQDITAQVEKLVPVTLQLEYGIQSDLLEAVRSNTIMSYQSVALLKEIEPYMIGKEPPFNMPEEVANKLARGLLLSLTVISNCLGSLISEVDYIVNELAHLVLVKDSKEFTRTFTVSIGLLCGLLLLLLIGFCVSTTNIQADLKHSLLMYQLLKVNEAQSQVRFYSEMISKINKSALDEASLTFEFLRIKTSSAGMPNSEGSQVISSRKSKPSSIGVAKIKHDFHFRSVKLISFWGSLVFTSLVVLIFFLGLLGSQLNQFLSTEDFYINSYRRLSSVNSQYLVFYTMAALGNFIKIDGKYPEDAWQDKSDSISRFVNFWLSHAAILPEFITDADIDKVNQLLYKEICSQLPNKTFTEIGVMNMCLQHIPARNGLLTYLTSEQDFFDTTIDFELNQDRSYLNKTKSQFVRTPLVQILLQPSVVSTFQLHHSLVGIFRTHIDGAIRRSLQIQTSTYERMVFLINVIGVTVLVILLFGFTKHTFDSVRTDTKVVLETAVTIRPHVFKLNPLIQKHMRKSFSNYATV